MRSLRIGALLLVVLSLAGCFSTPQERALKYAQDACRDSVFTFKGWTGWRPSVLAALKRAEKDADRAFQLDPRWTELDRQIRTLAATSEAAGDPTDATDVMIDQATVVGQMCEPLITKPD